MFRTKLQQAHVLKAGRYGRYASDTRRALEFYGDVLGANVEALGERAVLVSRDVASAEAPSEQRARRPARDHALEAAAQEAIRLAA